MIDTISCPSVNTMIWMCYTSLLSHYTLYSLSLHVFTCDSKRKLNESSNLVHRVSTPMNCQNVKGQRHWCSQCSCTSTITDNHSDDHMIFKLQSMWSIYCSHSVCGVWVHSYRTEHYRLVSGTNQTARVTCNAKVSRSSRLTKLRNKICSSWLTVGFNVWSWYIH